VRSISKLFLLLTLVLSSACAQQSSSEPEAQAPINSAPPAGNKDQNWWRPTPGTSWQIQLSGTVDTSFDVQVYDVDLFETEAKTIEQLHASGRKVICYFSAGSFEDWRSDAKNFPQEVLGKNLEGWPGERWLDVRQIEKLSAVMQARMDLAVQKKCDAVDPDNVDGYANDSGFPLSGENQLAYNRWLAAEAHRRGLAIGLKNDLGQIAGLVADFDFAINEECFQFNECDELLSFIRANKPVWGIEYQDNRTAFCPAANQMNFDTLKKNLDLDASRESCR